MAKEQTLAPGDKALSIGYGEARDNYDMKPNLDGNLRAVEVPVFKNEEICNDGLICVGNNNVGIEEVSQSKVV